MKTYCVKCEKDSENTDPKMFRTKKETNWAIKMSLLWN